jgi:adenylosuccinate lyase
VTAPRWESPLSTRYASPAMQSLWAEPNRVARWRRIWLALAEAERELGLDIPEAAVKAMRAHLDDADLVAAAEFERRFRHDVMAHIHAFGEQAPAARSWLHLGATSAFITDNADILIIRDALALVLARTLAVLEALRVVAVRFAKTPCVAYTHFQPAQLTTVGKRTTLWMLDLALDLEAILQVLETLRLRGCKGTTGTQASFLELFDGNDDKVRDLERRVADKLGLPRVFPVTGQTYSRKADARVIDALSGVAQSASKFAGDLRLLQHEGELLEPFESEQIGSSAMPYKRNPMRAERVSALARYVLALQANAPQTAATQWLERSLDDSANRRLVLPEAFLAVDAMLVLYGNIAAGLEVRDTVIARHVADQMPFMVTERWLMLATQAGGDRQMLHEVIRRHARAAADGEARGEANDLLERLTADPAFAAIERQRLMAELDPQRYVGRAPRQVSEFLGDFLEPLLTRARDAALAAEQAEVRV